jgi:hypothetical protein
MLEKTTNLVSGVGIVGYACVEAPAPPVFTPPVVPRPPVPGLPPVAPPVPPPGPPPVVYTYNYTDEDGNCWKVIDWGTLNLVGQPNIEKIPIECTGI